MINSILEKCYGVLTALVSIETAEAINIIENVTTISMIRAWASVPEGDVVPKFVIGCNSTRRVNEADRAPVICAPAYSGTCR